MYTKEREREMWREEKGRERKHSQGEKKKKGITKRVFTVRERRCGLANIRMFHKVRDSGSASSKRALG
jgi:hypothetical protein